MRGPITPAGRIGVADELLSQAVTELRDVLATNLESVALHRRVGETWVPIPESIDDIDVDGEQSLIELVVEIEEHLGGLAWPGPVWLDVVIAKARARWGAVS